MEIHDERLQAKYISHCSHRFHSNHLFYDHVTIFPKSYSDEGTILDQQILNDATKYDVLLMCVIEINIFFL